MPSRRQPQIVHHHGRVRLLEYFIVRIVFNGRRENSKSIYLQKSHHLELQIS